MAKKSARVSKTKIFVLDTNVLMYDPASLYRFKENDLFIPMTALEELDNNKKGITEVARNARQSSRNLDEIIRIGIQNGFNLETGFPLEFFNGGAAKGKLHLQPLQTIDMDMMAAKGLPEHKADNAILASALHLKEKYVGREVVIVSKDINLRIKALALSLPAEDYTNDHVVEDSDLVYTGFEVLADDFWEKSETRSTSHSGKMIWTIKNDFCGHLCPNQFIAVPSNNEEDLWLRVTERVDINTIICETIIDYTNKKHSLWGITARNQEQSLVLNLLMNPDIDFVTILGRAGSGKTMLTLASALTQIYEKNLFEELIFTRITVPVGDDIGFLPGNEEEKMRPWMGALEDNIDVLTKAPAETGDWGKAVTKDLVWSKLKIKSMNFMRGRTFVDRLLVIDEAQNLTPKQVKTLITRAGPGTKIVCMGNLAQIDTPYITESNSGLTYAVERMKNYVGGGHITLSKVERSRLAEFAESEL